MWDAEAREYFKFLYVKRGHIDWGAAGRVFFGSVTVNRGPKAGPKELFSVCVTQTLTHSTKITNKTDLKHDRPTLHTRQQRFHLYELF